MQKFAFDTEFARDGSVVREAAPVQKRFSAADLEAAKARAFADGASDAAARAARDLADASARIARDVERLCASMQGEIARNREDAAHLAIAAARAIADVALDAHGHERVAAAVDAALSSLNQSPRVVVTASPAHVEQLRAQFDQIAPHIQGRIIVREKADAAPGDARIEWGEGAVEIDRAAIIEDIEARVRRALTQGAES